MSFCLRLSAIALFGLVTSCGGGTAALLASRDGGGGGSGNSTAVVGDLELTASRSSPAEIRFVLKDQESDPLDVEILVVAGSADPQPVQLTADPDRSINKDLTQLATSPDEGTQHTKLWDYAQVLGAKYREGLTLEVRAGGSSEQILVNVGNDPPSIHVPSSGIPPSEVAGIVELSFIVFDSSSDSVSVYGEYAIADELDLVGGELPGDDDFFAATRAGEPPGPEPVSQQGTSLDYSWNVEQDLGSSEHDILFRLTVIDYDESGDPLSSSEPALTPVFTVDNDREPAVILNAAAFATNPDRNRGIPIPFTVLDDDGDPVQLVFQWRDADQSFEDPALDISQMSVAEILDVLEDHDQRRRYQVCTEKPISHGGRVVPLDLTTYPKGEEVRLPELATSAASLLASGGIVGRELEIHRASKLPYDITVEWQSNPLRFPRGALPIGTGLNALVLDSAGPTTWRLREIELATGEVVRTFVDGTEGEPDVLAWEPGGAAVLVATHDATNAWRIHRIDLEMGLHEVLLTADGTTEAGSVRGLAGLGRYTALITVAGSLIKVHYEAVPATGVTLMGPGVGPGNPGLNTPWGLAVDTRFPHRVFLAERAHPGATTEGRVLLLDLDGYRVTQITPILNGNLLGLPESLSLDPTGEVLHAVIFDPVSGQREVRGVRVFGSGSDFNLVTQLGEVTSIQHGPDDLVLLALADQNQLLVGGGLEQVRSVRQYDPFTQIATLDRPVQPRPASDGPPKGWRIIDEVNPSPAQPEGYRDFFVWDSGDVPSMEDVVIRGIPLGSEVGTQSDTGAPRRVTGKWWPRVLQDPALFGPKGVIAADTDGDGDLDLVAVNEVGHDLRVFFQQSPGEFSVPLVLNDGIFQPQSVAAADLDGDGDLDLVSAQANTLTVFYQDTPGSFGDPPLVLTDPGIGSPVSVSAIDLDGDGDLDLQSSSDAGVMVVFFQSSPGSFPSSPLVLDSGAFVTDSVAADVDGDGDLDLVASHTGSSSVAEFSVFLQQATGAFDDTPLVVDAPELSGASSLAAADVDGDGDVDLVGSNERRISVFFQDAVGSFDGPPLIIDDPGLRDVSSVAATDVDEDGDFDLVVASRSSSLDRHVVLVFFQDAAGSFMDPPQFLQDTHSHSPQSVTPADLDGDGDVDLAVANSGQFHDVLHPDNLTVFFQGGGVLGGSSLTLKDANMDFPTSVAAADLDADGDLDIVAGSWLSSNLMVFLQDDPRSFGIPATTLVPPGAAGVHSVAAADLDGNSYLDLVSANALNLTVYFQTAPGSFASPPLILDACCFLYSVAVADFDSDGDLDLASGLTSGGLVVFFQDAPGSFGGPPLVLNHPVLGTFSIAAADLDGDGDMDLVSADVNNDSLMVLFQDAPGSFGGPPLVLTDPGIEEPTSVAAADLDGDGDQDLVSANRGSGNISVFYQGPPGSFGDPPLLLSDPAVLNPSRIAPIDIDSDGDLDLATAGAFSTDLVVFIQQGPRSFGGSPLVLESQAASSLTVADIDGDGDLDLVASNPEEGGGSLTVFFGME